MQAFDALLMVEQAVRAASVGNVDAIYQTVVDTSLPIMPNADGALIQICEDDDVLVLRAASGTAARRIGQRKLASRSFAGRCIQVRQPMICDDIEIEDGVDRDEYRRAGMRSLLSVPIVHRNATVGALKFYAKDPSAFEDKDLTIAQLIAAQIVSGLMTIAEEAAISAHGYSEARFRAITETLPQLVWTMSPTGVVTYRNLRASAFTGKIWPTGEQSDPSAYVAADHLDEASELWRDLLAHPRSIEIEARLRPRTGDPRWIQLHLIPVHDAAAGVREWIGVGVDIDHLKSLELELKEAVNTRDVLLQEVNHRVKNSLQIAIGLLALQASRITSPDVRERLVEAREQIVTIAKVHQSIYRAAEHDHIDFGALLRNLAQGLVRRGDRQRARLSLTIGDNVILSLDQGVPVALIAVELMTNAIKHGKPTAGEPTVEVKLARTPRGVVLDVRDHGPGLPGGFDRDQSMGLGMDIVFGLAEQIGATVEAIESDTGAHLRLTVTRH